MNVCYWIILTHFLSDWVLQPRAVAKKKATSLPWLMVHLAIINLCVSNFVWFLGG